MNYICEMRDGSLWVRGRCSPKEKYTGWIIRDLEIPTPNILTDEQGHLIWRVDGDMVVKDVSSLTPKEQTAKNRPTIEMLEARIAALERRP